MKIIRTLFLIRLRRLVAKDDLLAMFFVIMAFLLIPFFLNSVFDKIKNYLLFFTLEVLVYHTNRKDLELLKLNKNYKFILFAEYFIYTLPYVILFLVNKEYLLGFIFAALLLLFINLPKINNSKMSYPFSLFDPFWHISFRKNKLIVVIPVIVFLFIMGEKSGNENLKIASLLLTGVVATFSSFNRESIEHIKSSFYLSKHYLIQQIIANLKNTLIISFPILLCIILFRNWDLLLFAPLLFLLPVLNILFKYTFFENTFMHQIAFVASIGTIYFGTPFIIAPFLYKKSLTFIKNAQNA
ncbi:hypothetical protein [Flavobacterium sp.]|uniref:hypothetical protein n=1 Tax=Flavobacterium sp. TaxID=239 RepID=UPI00374FDD54